MVIQGRKITPADIHLINQLLINHPSWNRTRLSRELCKKWEWLRPNGQQLKDMACRTLLLKLERAGYIKLPPRQLQPVNKFRTDVPTERQYKTWCNSLFPKSFSSFRQFLSCGYFYISAWQCNRQTNISQSYKSCT